MKICLLPVPKTIEERSGIFRFTGKETILLCGGSRVDDYGIAHLLATTVRKRVKIPAPIARSLGAPEPGCINLALEEGHPPEGYRVEVSNDSVTLGASSSRGLLYGVRTLEQVIEQTGGEIPCMTIQDSPDFEHRGFYHDISRGKVPKYETMRLLIEKASRYKLNQLQFYVEHVFAFRTNPAIWKGFDVLTPEEVLGLDEYARSLHVDLVPSLASFGHMYEILRNPAYSHLSEVRDFDPSKQPLWKNRMEYHTIDVSNGESCTLLGRMFDDYLSHFSSLMFNICCDETWYPGMDRNRERAEREGAGALYLGHILRLYEMVKKHGKRVMMWGDIPVKYPEFIDRLPDDIVLLNWEYGEAVTEKQSALFGSRRNEFHNCPGVAGWNLLINNIDAASKNIRRLSREYETVWRVRNKESELSRITEVFRRIVREAEAIAAG